MANNTQAETAGDGAGDETFRLQSGAEVRLGWLATDLPFLTRSLRFLLRSQGELLREPFAMEPGDVGVLILVFQNPDISQNDLASSLVLKKSAVTKVVQRLERRELLERRRSAADRRSNALRLTAEGEALVTRVHERAEQMHARWFRDIAPEERAVFFSVLLRLVAGLAAEQPARSAENGDAR